MKLADPCTRERRTITTQDKFTDARGGASRLTDQTQHRHPRIHLGPRPMSSCSQATHSQDGARWTTLLPVGALPEAISIQCHICALRGFRNCPGALRLARWMKAQLVRSIRPLIIKARTSDLTATGGLSVRQSPVRHGYEDGSEVQARWYDVHIEK